MILPSKIFEKHLFSSGYDNIIAIDEVGVGCLAGPVVVCATVFSENFFQKTHKKLHWLRDSKLLVAKKREDFRNALLDEDIIFELAQSSPKIIDQLNIYGATRLAMRKAIAKLTKRLDLKPENTVVIIDGNTKIKGVKFEQIPIVKGDRRVFAIACASVIAKVHRDNLMTRLAKKYNNYGFEKHKGYGTKFHQAMLTQFGPCVLHRRSFAPVAKLNTKY